MPSFEVVDLGLRTWAEAWDTQQDYVARRKRNLAPDTVLFVEHPHTITLGRNAELRHILAPPERLAELGVAVHEANRGGDVTYHGPGQIVAYPVFDLTGWKKDVRAYVRGLEQAVIHTLAEYGITAHTREGKETGVYVQAPGDAMPAKVCALGVHISRWVTSHGFALNLSTDLRYFQHIVPCGLALPVTSMEALGVKASRAEVTVKLTRQLSEIFVFEPQLELQETLP
jgi:lipoyl(octanoyl) transferase